MHYVGRSIRPAFDTGFIDCSNSQIPDGEWQCMFNPDPLRRSCQAAEEKLPDDDTIQSHSGHVTAGEAEGKMENVEFVRQMLRKYLGVAGKSNEIALWLNKGRHITVRSPT